MSEILLRCDHVGKTFCRNLKRSLWYGVQDVTAELLGFAGQTEQSAPHIKRELRTEEFWAVDDVSFTLQRGECLGLIGRNGAGKTTLLKMLNGLIKPDSGRIALRGRVGGLIALGAGFDPDLTGRENVFINGAILGLSRKQIAARFEEIVEFAEIGEFIDSPVGNYSSGMQVRLGFSVAAKLIRPDILLLDEVLAVGDLGFRLKCLNLVQELLADSAVVFVSHSMQFVTRFCTQLAVMSSGRMIEQSHDLARGLQAYYEQCGTSLRIFGNETAVISGEKLLSNGAEFNDGETPSLNRGDALELELDIALHENTPPVDLQVMIEDYSGQPVLAIHPEDQEKFRFTGSQTGVRLDLGSLNLAPGKYGFMLALVSAVDGTRLSRKAGELSFHYGGDHVPWAPVIHEARVRRAA